MYLFLKILGSWYVSLYYSSSEEALTYRCMKVQFGLSEGNMDMRMTLNYRLEASVCEFSGVLMEGAPSLELLCFAIFRYVNNPNEDEVETGNMTWQIPDPMRPEHWLHSEDHCKLR